jgi:hypothetical protein
MSAIKNSGWILIGLCLLMAATRFDHFGSLSTLPDASLAVFFFGGLYLRNTPWFVLLLVEAALIDFVAINYGGVSDYCISPAYLFLIPTYGTLWLAGYMSTRFNLFSRNGLVLTTATLVVAVSLAFLISNSSFYLLSGRFADLNWVEYFNQVAKYYSPYLLTALMYASVIVIIHATASLIVSSKDQHQSWSK